MGKIFFKATIFFFFIYLTFWFSQNLDFDSVLTTTKDTIKYEFRMENLQRGIEALNKAIE